MDITAVINLTHIACLVPTNNYIMFDLSQVKVYFFSLVVVVIGCLGPAFLIILNVC